MERDQNNTELDFHSLALGAGIKASMPDTIPVIGVSMTEENLYHAFGFSAHGFQLGPIVGKILADLITQGTTDLPIEPFSISRFGASRPRAASASPLFYY